MTVENDLLTPTFKLKRDKVKNFFLQEIKDMYDGSKLQGEDKNWVYSLGSFQKVPIEIQAI